MGKQEQFFEVGISRHAPKVEKGVVEDITKQKVDIEAAGPLVEERVKTMLENLDRAPSGTILAFESSNIDRAQKTQVLFEEKLREMTRGRNDVEFVELGEGENSAIFERIRKEPEKKFILSGLRSTWLIGWKKDDPSLLARTKWKNKLGGDEDLLGKIWAVHKHEVPALVKELKKHGLEVSPEELGPKEFYAVPEESVIRFVKWIEALKRIGDAYFPKRPLILEGISHNLRSDYTLLALLDEDISLESINRVLGGEFRKPLERSSIVFNQRGGVHIEYRDKVKDYSKGEFQEVIRNIRKKMKARRQEWGLDVGEQ